ncbi:hypothetical protein [Siminovitchia sp. 179-K 8D1 HS]|uniref:hypothetical protein n=1 Tax=Siminovitchia sp. 179-K 8D1 HS TaxID=3142385 RepID=UPI0039A30DA6
MGKIIREEGVEKGIEKNNGRLPKNVAGRLFNERDCENDSAFGSGSSEIIIHFIRNRPFIRNMTSKEIHGVL